MSFPLAWQAVPAADLIRVGPQYDGGYGVSMSTVKASDRILSFGLNDDWRFEQHLLSIIDVPLSCYDHTVNYKFWVLHFVKSALNLRLAKLFHYFRYRAFFNSDKRRHVQSMIGYDVDGGVSLGKLMREVPERNVFLKMDIEGSEYRVLDQIIENKQRFSGLVIEFHDVDLQRKRIEHFVAALDTHAIVWVHANNYGGRSADGDPMVIEVSFARKDLLPVGSTTTAPVVRHHPNNPDQAEIELTFA